MTKWTYARLRVMTRYNQTRYDLIRLTIVTRCCLAHDLIEFEKKTNEDVSYVCLLQILFESIYCLSLHTLNCVQLYNLTC